MKRLRWGLIGCGDISRKRVAPALRAIPECDLVAINRARSELAADFAAEFGVPRWYGDWHELIADDEIDAVYIATPVSLHAEQTIFAAEAGKHVLCEKPMALNVAECDRMIDACRSNQVRLGIAYYRHFYPAILRASELIASGEIGMPVIARVNAFERFNPAPDEDRYWLMLKSLAGGGPMMDFGCHRIEVLMNLLGPIRDVKSMTGRTVYEREVEDTSLAIFSFEQGAQGVLAVTHAAFESQDTLDIFCSGGSIHIPVLNLGEMQIKTTAGERVEQLPPHRNIHQPLIEDFTAAVLESRAPVVDHEIGREVSRVLEIIYA